MKILFIGDSNTWGWDPRQGASIRMPKRIRWPQRVCEAMHAERAEDSLPGRKIPDGVILEGICGTIEKNRDADFLVLLLGTNDMIEMMPGNEDRIVSRWGAALNKMRTVLGEKHAERILLCVPPPIRTGQPVNMDGIRNGYKRVAEAHHTRFLDLSGLPLELMYDGIHLSEKDQETVAKAVVQALRQPCSFRFDSREL